MSNNKVVAGFIYSFIEKEYVQSNFIHTNLHLLSRKRNYNTYNEGATKICDIGRNK
jgi:hypothetical protein